MSQNQLVDDLKPAISDILGSLCQSCDSVYPSDAELNCSASGRLAYFTAGLVYSAPDGGVTASTLVTRLHTWLLSEDAPSLLVDGTRVALRKECPTQLNAITRSDCTELFIPDNAVTNPPTPSPSLLVGLFAAGLTAGVVITALIAAVIIIW